MELDRCGGLGKKVSIDAGYRWELRRAYENGQTREQWLASKPAKEITRLKIWSNVEPIGSDAVLYQIARGFQKYLGGNLDDYLILKSEEFQQTEEQIFAALDKVLPKKTD